MVKAVPLQVLKHEIDNHTGMEERNYVDDPQVKWRTLGAILELYQSDIFDRPPRSSSQMGHWDPKGPLVVQHLFLCKLRIVNVHLLPPQDSLTGVALENHTGTRNIGSN